VNPITRLWEDDEDLIEERFADMAWLFVWNSYLV